MSGKNEQGKMDVTQKNGMRAFSFPRPHCLALAAFICCAVVASRFLRATGFIEITNISKSSMHPFISTARLLGLSSLATAQACAQARCPSRSTSLPPSSIGHNNKAQTCASPVSKRGRASAAMSIPGKRQSMQASTTFRG